MLWEKRNLTKPDKRGYLYIRETIYVRDKRTKTRKPRKLGSGKAHKERAKYSKKKDIYCGKIIECDMKKFQSFEEYMREKEENYLEYRIKARFKEIVNDFKNYLLNIYDIEQQEYEQPPKKAFEMGNGYLSKQTIEHLNNFTVRKGADQKKEIERFAFRCEDAGIFDPEIIHLLFTKIAPEVSEDVKKELEQLKKHKTQTQEFEDFRQFMRKQHKN